MADETFMASLSFSAFCRRSLTVVGCTLAITLNAALPGHHALQGHIPPAAARLKPAGALAETNRLQLALGLPLRHEAELTALLRDLYDPSSSKFHQFLKPPEFAARFGPTEEDYAAVSAFAQSHGLRVVRTHANRLLLDVEGSVTSVQDAFHVRMNVFQHPTENRTFYAPETEPSVESNLPLLHISGLDNYLLPKSNLMHRSGPNRGSALTGSGPNGAFMGADFRAAYAPGVTLDGTGQTVALVEFDTFDTHDIATYEDMASLPHVPVTSVFIDSFSGPPAGGQDEVSLDIELSIAMAPGLSQVLVYSAPYGYTSVDDDLLNQIAVDDLANQIACCWIYTIDVTSDIIFLEMAAQGQSFYNASGDYGAYDVDPLPLLSDANVTLVGGTSLTTKGPRGAWVSETVWNWFTTGQGAGASSGGISATYPIPYWQQTLNLSSNQGSTIWRNLPDVSMTGDNVLVVTSGVSESIGGTSCATPLWAGFTALINQQAAQNGLPPVGFLAPAIYAAAQGPLYPSLFHDITSGNNTNYNGATQFYAVPGYDLCTGWGTPTGQTLINALAPPDNLILDPKGGSILAVINGLPPFIETQTLALKNPGTTNINWALGPVPSWLSASVTHGSLSPGEAAFVTLSPADASTNLPPGDYVTDVLVTNLTDDVTHLFPVSLEVFDPLFIETNSGMAVIGPPGGPFSETTQTFSLGNSASVPINWTAQSTSAFLGFSPASGTLGPGEVTNILAELDQSASNLLITAQTGSLLFTDLNTSNTQSQPFTLTVGNGGFETGDFSDWTLDGGGFPTNFVGGVPSGLVPPIAWVAYIHSGADAALLGQPYITASLSQTLPTVAGQLYDLSFFMDNPVGGGTNQFEVNWDGTPLFNQEFVPQMPWTNVVFTVYATNTPTILEFVVRNDPDYFGLDDISVTPVTPPVFSSASLSGNSILFSWNAISGARYQLQFSLDLISWGNAGFAITATNSVMTAKETIRHSDVQEYYRLYLLVN
jgi:hypothetical protein